MHFHLEMLITDWLIWILALCALLFFIYIRRIPHLREPWQRVARHRVGMAAATLLFVYILIGLLDSIHFEMAYPDQKYKISQIQSLLDVIFLRKEAGEEESYSAPFATHSYSRTIQIVAGKERQVYERLKYGGAHLEKMKDKSSDIFFKILRGILKGILFLLLIYALLLWWLAYQHASRYWSMIIRVFRGRTAVAWREILITLAIVVIILFSLAELAAYYHVMGTDKVGHDTFYSSIKSVRTGLLIGTLTTLFMLPFALILGMIAGFFGGWWDDAIQYLYTTLSSIPAVLLISATILVMQVYIASHATLFPTLAQRADARLLALCLILGVTSWASLCRLLRAESLKLRELEFVQAAETLGVRKIRIVFRHIMPNIMHIVLITIVLDFSMLVLAEAVLSYVGVGVDPTTFSWGNMINSSRLEFAREPMVWWPLVSALIFMFLLVISANLFSDAVRDALDPRTRAEIEA